MQHVAAVFGDIAEREAVPVRIHREQPESDMFAPARGRRSWVEPALDVFRREGNGVLILLRSPLVDDVALDGRDEGGTHEEESHASAVARRRRWRDVGVGAQILRELGVRSIRAVATEERGYVGLTGFGIDIAETILIEP